MKRQCNEQEVEILFRNRYNFYDGIFSIKARSNAAKYLWMFLGGAIMSIIIYNAFSHIVPPRILIKDSGQETFGMLYYAR